MPGPTPARLCKPLAALAQDFGLTLAVEPEHSNVVATAEQAIMMLDQVGSPALKIVYDAANLLDPDGYTGRAYAGELGRTRIPSTDGSTAQVEQISSGTAIAGALIAAGTDTSLATVGRTDITAGTVAAAAAAGDHVARSIFTTAAATLGIQLANLTRLVDPEAVALCGGVTLAGDIFWGPLRATIGESLAQDFIPLPRLVEAELRGDAGLHGAAIALPNHYERAAA